jgi:hypothetical protein
LNESADIVKKVRSYSRYHSLQPTPKSLFLTRSKEKQLCAVKSTHSPNKSFDERNQASMIKEGDNCNLSTTKVVDDIQFKSCNHQ